MNLGKPGYLEEVAKETADIDVSIVFCNAGYMLTGFFDSMCAQKNRLMLKFPAQTLNADSNIQHDSV